MTIGRQRHEPPAVWTPETLRVHISALLNEKDKRDQQRFDAQEKALADALIAVEKSTQATFVAADRATSKAETAADERFKSVNEFRAQLNDLIATFMPRSEASGRIDGLAARMEVAANSIGERIDRVNAEVDALQLAQREIGARTQGLHAGWGYLVAAVGMVATMITVGLAIIAVTR